MTTIKIGGSYIDENTGIWLDIWSELSRQSIEEELKKTISEKYKRYMNILMMVIAYRLNLSEKEVKKIIINREYYDSIPPFMFEWPYF